MAVACAGGVAVLVRSGSSTCDHLDDRIAELEGRVGGPTQRWEDILALQDPTVVASVQAEADELERLQRDRPRLGCGATDVTTTQPGGRPAR